MFDETFAAFAVRLGKYTNSLPSTEKQTFEKHTHADSIGNHTLLDLFCVLGIR